MVKGSGIYRFFCYALLAVILAVSLFPIYWMLNTSFKLDKEIYLAVPTFYPHVFSLDGYITLFTKTSFLPSLYNSALVSLIVSILSVFFCMLAAYSISRLNVWGGRGFSKGVLYTYLLPRTLMFIPLYMMASKLKIAGSTIGLMIIYPTFTKPYSLWTLIPYFRTIPKEIEESALVDGGSLWCLMFQVFFPLCIPGIAATFIFCFTQCWNEYIYALVMITDSWARTFPLMLSGLMVDDIYAWGPLMAGAVLSCLPILFVYVLSSGKVIGGLTAGAVKQ
jgi:multiple sugar transport system permease protein